MSKFFVVSNQDQEISVMDAIEVLARNSVTWFELDSPIPYYVLAQAETKEQTERFLNNLKSLKS